MKQLMTSHAKLCLVFFLVVTLGLGFFASKVEVSSDFKNLLPESHPYLLNMLSHQDDLSLGSEVRLIVESGKDETIFDARYVEWLRQLTDKVYELPSANKAYIKSIWTANARWIAITADGFQGGKIIPSNYDGSEITLSQVKDNILRSSEVGRIVADDFKSSVVVVPLVWGEGDKALDYEALHHALESLRTLSREQGYELRIIGVAKKIGELIVGAQQMALFFLVAVVFIFFAVWVYTASLRVAVILTVSGIFGVVWQLGLVSFLGQYWSLGLDPYSMLVPFLIFAISISHGLQLCNTAALVGDRHQGWSSFQQLRKPASLALLSDAIGFATLVIIPIGAIRDLAFTASLGVFCLFFTTLFLVPLLIQVFGVGIKFEARVQRRQKLLPGWVKLSMWCTRGVGRIIMMAIVLILIAYGVYASQQLQIGDLRSGAPELRPDSQYNQDIAYFTQQYSQSVDVYIALVRTPVDQCNTPQVLFALEDFQAKLAVLDGVQDSFSLSDSVKRVNRGLSEGFPKWSHVPNSHGAINSTTAYLPDGFMNLNCSFSPVYIFLKDHKAATLKQVTTTLENFDAELQLNNEFDLRIVPAAGNAGIEAAVNDSIDQQQRSMLMVIYAVVFLLCLMTFRRISLVLAILIPLGMTSLLCQALMTLLDIGVKVSTLPVIALGVGIGVDYGVYICARYLQTNDMTKALVDTGTVVGFTGLALAISVGTWIFSAIQFQADMGALLTFMFTWNLLGALMVLPFLLSIFHRPITKTSHEDNS